MKKTFSLYGGFAVVFALGLFFGYFWGQQGRLLSPPASLESAKNQFQLMIDYGDDTMTTVNDAVFSQGETVFTALGRVLKEQNIELGFKEYKGLGTMVTNIGTKENGQGKRYWQYWVNGKHPDVGADQYLLKPRDVVEWKFTSPPLR